MQKYEKKLDTLPENKYLTQFTSITPLRKKALESAKVRAKIGYMP